MKGLISLILLLATLMLTAQNQYHVFPADHKKTPGSASGFGSMSKPWDITTALSKSDRIKGGDTIWIHKGVYSGRFISSVSGIQSKPVVIMPYKNEKVVLDGNAGGTQLSVLRVEGGNVEFHDLEITFKGDFSRREGEDGFRIVNGINHVEGEDCKFINLKIHNNPGSGIGSWKHTGGSQIIGCLIFNNGYYTKVRGSGVGVYVQNLSDKERLLENNFIFNNYYKGVEVWSGSSGSKFNYIKNITLRNNVIFNNGLPAGRHVDNVIIASADADGINAPTNIKLLSNILYHNTDFTDNTNFGDGASLTLGYGGKAPIVKSVINDNIIVGKNNGFRILDARDYTFRGNQVYSGYVVMYKTVLPFLNPSTWRYADNNFFTRRRYLFRIEKERDYQMHQWKEEYGIEAGNWNFPKYFDLPELIHKSKVEGMENRLRIALFEKDQDQVLISFDEKETNGASGFKVRDIATREILFEGELPVDKSISFPMDNRNLTDRFMNVYEVEFTSAKKSRRGLFRRLFGWLF